MTPVAERSELWLERLIPSRQRLAGVPELVVEGKLSRMVGLTLEAEGCRAAIGSLCQVETKTGKTIGAEVVGFAGARLFLMPTGDTHGLEPGCRVIPLGKNSLANVGFGLLGRVLDGAGNALDNKGPLDTDAKVSLAGTTINPLSRKPIREALDVGVRAINSVLSVGRGQRMGLFPVPASARVCCSG